MHTINNWMKKLAGTGMINFVFLGFLFLFLVDNIVNQFTHLPVFVAGGIVLTLAFLPYVWAGIRKNAWIYVCLVVLFLLMVINSFKDGFDVRNVSDLFFLVLFVISYMAYSAARDKLKTGYAYVFVIATVLLFLGPSVHALFQSSDKHATMTVSHREASIPATHQDSSLYIQSRHFEHDRAGFLSTLHSKSENSRASGQLDEAEEAQTITSRYKRKSVNSGFFRLAHVAAYFLGFSSVFFAFLAFKQKQYLWLLPAVILFYLALYTYARVFFVALALSGMVYLMRRKYLIYLTPLVVLGFMVIYFRHNLFEVFQDSFLQPYFGLVILLSDHLWEDSRILIWGNWFREVSGFQWYEYLTGRSYISGLNANQENLSTAWWFHNDFLGLFYTYGLVGVAFYTAFLRKIYNDFKDIISCNIFVFQFCVMPLWLAIFNGFYYYFPVFLLYLFFVMASAHHNGLMTKTENG